MECGCRCESCVNNNSLYLHKEIEYLKRQLADREYHIMQMENQMMHNAIKFPNGEIDALQESLRFWQEKYERLLEGHRKLQKVNQGLEDKLLRIADKFESEKSALMRDVSDLTNKLIEANIKVNELEEDSEQYRNDCNIAVQLLQCKPSSFVAHKFNTLPLDLQEKVRLQINHRRTKSSPCNASLQQLQPSNNIANSGQQNGARIIRVPIPTFPPTAMFYSVNKVNEESSLPITQNDANDSPDYVSAAIMAKVLEERSKERKYTRIMKCHQCRNKRAYVQYIDEETQTNHATLYSDDYQYNSYSHFIRHRPESSSSIESLCNSNIANIVNTRTCNETIII